MGTFTEQTEKRTNMTDRDYVFDAWYYDECSIDAAEVVGPNSVEYDDLHTRFYEDDNRREAARLQYYMHKG